MKISNKMIFCTGVFLVPKQISKDSWTWIPVSFEDDSFNEDGDYVEINESAETEDGLIEDAEIFDASEEDIDYDEENYFD